MAFALTNKSGTVEEGPHEYVKTLIGVCLPGDTDNLPAVGYTDAALYATSPGNAITDYICQSVQRVKTWQAGRDLVIAKYNKLKAA